jgi:hypothetical protein
MSSHDEHALTPVAASEAAYDQRDPNTLWVVGFALASLVTLVGILAGVSKYFDYVEEQQIYIKQILPVSEDLKQLRAKEEHDLHRYGWADKAAGTVRIPVERAIDLYLSELASGKVKYPTEPQLVKTEAALDPQGGAPVAQPAAH